MKQNREKILNLIRDAGSFTHLLSAATRFLFVILVICVIYGGFAQKGIADNVVRLHIIANSDSKADQELKLKVRDAILENMQKKYPDGATRDETVQYLKKNLPEIGKVATDVLKENGSDESIVAKYGVFPFPTKQYDNVVLPAGMYEAVRIEIGNAKGQNWWCVMFPPLCIADDNSVRMSQKSQDQLRASLGDDNFSLVTDIADSKNIPVQVKFRIVELVQTSRIKLAELISSLF